VSSDASRQKGQWSIASTPWRVLLCLKTQKNTLTLTGAKLSQLTSASGTEQLVFFSIL
jgi:hypothetical protein